MFLITTFKMKTNFKKEIARDFLSLGSWVFFILVIGRALIQPYRPFSDQMIIAGLLLIVLGLICYKINFEFDGYIAKGVILVVFTILFYENMNFNYFAIAAMIGLLISSYYVENKWGKILKGLIIGLVITLISYYLADYSLNLIGG